MLLSESVILNIIEEETRACIKESLLLEQTTWKIPDDNTYEYSLTPDGKSYIAYEGGKPIGTFSDAAGLEKVKAAAPDKEQGWGDWLKGKLGYGEKGQKRSSPKRQVKPKVAPTEIEYYTTFKGKLKALDEERLKRGLEARGIIACEVDQCAQFVSENLSQVYTKLLGTQGNAWLAHRWWMPGLISTFNDKASLTAPKAAQIFSKLNIAKSFEKGELQRMGQDKKIMHLVQSIIPNQDAFKGLGIGTVVGLYYPISSYHSYAFFESATQGDFFRTKSGKAWNSEMMGKNIIFEPSPKYAAGRISFGMNSHLGLVGAVYNGEPIVFHNVLGEVRATPLRAMSPNKVAIVWASPRGGGGRIGMAVGNTLKSLGVQE